MTTEIRAFKNSPGLTLLELLTAVAIISIMVGLGIPSIKIFYDKHLLHTHTNEIVFDLHIARSEAIKNRTETTLCKSSELAACDNKREWHEGWIIFSDTNKNKQFDGDEILIRYRPPSHPSITINYSGFRGGNRVSYSPLGTPSTFNGSFKIKNSTQENKVVISRVGRIRTENDS